MTADEATVTQLESEATLTYLTNPAYRRSMNAGLPSDEARKAQAQADRKFYRRRIAALTKDMLRGEEPDAELRRMFEDYAQACVVYLQQRDTHEILQADYPPGNGQEDGDTELPDMDITAETLASMARAPPQESCMERFVTRTWPPARSSNPPPPTKKQINLKAPELRRKGLPSKHRRKKI